MLAEAALHPMRDRIRGLPSVQHYGKRWPLP